MFRRRVVIFLLLLLLCASTALAQNSSTSSQRDEDGQSCPPVESLTQLLQGDYEVFIGTRRSGITDEQLTLLEARFNETVARASLHHSLSIRLFEQLHAALQRQLFHQLRAALSVDWDARINNTVAIAINATQDSFFQAYASLFKELNATVRSDFEEFQSALSKDLESVFLAINTTQNNFFQLYAELFEELNSTLRSDFQRSETTLHDTIYGNLLQATHNDSQDVLKRLLDIEEIIALIQLYVDTSQPPGSVCCGVRDGWSRIAYLDMTDPSHSCPPAWREVTSPKRTCARTTDGSGCDSAVFPANGYRYSRVCGRIRAYQCGQPEAFNTGYFSISIGHYVDGISITHSDPRQHVWSFAAGRYESVSGGSACPCSSGYIDDNEVPSFVGDDYFCDTGADTSPPVCDLNTGAGVFPDDPLWDGEGCGPNTSTCCEFNNPPWFCKTLPQPTTDDLEVRLCSDGITGGSEDTPIELIEIYVN